MSEIKEKIAYLNGLKDGMNIIDSNTNKLFAAVIDALNSVADHIEESDAYVDELAEEIDLINDELDEFEDYVDELVDDCDDDDDCDCDCGCDCDDDDCVEIECPFCKETICFDGDEFISGEELRCPCCDKVVFPAED